MPERPPVFPPIPPYPATAAVSARVAFILDTVMMYVATRVTHRASGPFGVIIPQRIERLVNGWLMKRRVSPSSR
jgi:hypothetical protein